jgi:hypothetical protein
MPRNSYPGRWKRLDRGPFIPAACFQSSFNQRKGGFGIKQVSRARSPPVLWLR